MFRCLSIQAATTCSPPQARKQHSRDWTCDVCKGLKAAALYWEAEVRRKSQLDRSLGNNRR